MSLILSKPVGFDRWQLYCQVCGQAVGIEELSGVVEMARAGVEVKCFNCAPEGCDGLPAHVYYLDSTFMLGIGGRAFLCSWRIDADWNNGLRELSQGDLEARPISHACYYDLKTGRVQYLSKKRSAGLVVLGGGK